MDRTAWIVVTLCALGMGICLYLMNQQAPPRAPSAAPPVQVAPANGNPEAPDIPVEGAAGDPAVTAGPPKIENDTPEQFNTIETENARWVFTNHGGGIAAAHLLPGLYVGDEAYIINDQGSDAVGALSTGVGVADTVYELISPEGESPVIYRGVLAGGIVVEKTFSLAADAAGSGYLWDLQVMLSNPTDGGRKEEIYLYLGNSAAVNASDLIKPSVGWSADNDTDSWDMGKFKSPGFLGFGRRGDTPEDFVRKGRHSSWKWMALFNQFYTSLLSPRDVNKPENIDYWIEYTEGFVPAAEGSAPESAPQLTGMLHMGAGPGLVSLDAGASTELRYELYMGPRSHNILEAIDRESRDDGRAANREDVLFYGWFGMVSRFLMSTLTLFERYVGSWGVAIVLLTICIRIVIWPLHAKSHNTMKRMALLSPKMQELKEKYPNDPQKMQQEVMKLYRDFGVSPVGGCLPIFLQFPIFLGYYRMLQSAVELRGQGFLWATDLSVPDTVATFAGVDINPLPLVMTVTMFIQMKMTPKSEDKNVQAQQRMFMLMPFVFLFICYNFASALALYWTVQNIFGIGQTLIMKRMPEPTLEKRAPRAPFAPPLSPGQKPKKKKPKPPRTGG